MYDVASTYLRFSCYQMYLRVVTFNVALSLSAYDLAGGQLEDEVPQPRGTTTWEDNSSDADYDDDTGEADDEFCVPTTPPERRGPY
jgi:hypothetical protein